MALDAATLALTAAELKATLTDAKIAKLFEPTRDELVLTLRTRTDTYALLLSARSGSARVCLTEESFENPETPPSFCMLMRKHLTGGKLLDVHMEPGDPQRDAGGAAGDQPGRQQKQHDRQRVQCVARNDGQRVEGDLLLI